MKDIQEDNIQFKFDVLFAYIRETASVEECRLVETWLGERAENEKLLMQVANIYHAHHTWERIQARDSLAAFENVTKKIKYRNGRQVLRRLSVVAACLFLGILISSYWFRKPDIGLSQRQIVTVRANPGMRTSFNLPDGTVAYLNSGSSLSYPFPYDKDKREVSLNGEAYFKVTPNPLQPFIVSVADDRLQVEVLGTEFNMQAFAEEEQIETTLVTGRVDLRLKNENGTFTKQELYPSEKATFDLRARRLQIEKVNTNYVTAWTEGKLMFKDCPLSKVLKNLSYFYNVKFQVEDPLIETYCFTGTFQDKQLFQVLEYLKISSKIDYVINPMLKDDDNGTEHTTVVLKNMRSM